MSGRGRKRRAAAPDRVPKRTRASDERVTLFDDGPPRGQGTTPRLPLVEEMFNINAILNDPIPANTQQSPSGALPSLPQSRANTLPSFSFDVVEEPVDLVKCADDDLSVHVPQQLKRKIWDNKYINIVLLLKGNAELAEICSGGVLHVSDGKVEARPKQTKEKVNSIEQWTEAFLIFMSIYLSRYPDKTQELLKYISVIRDAAAKFPNYSWRHYDEQFRARQEKRVANWGQIHSDLWLRTMSVSSTTSTSDVSQFGSCRDFNNQGFCNFYRCRYQHSCDLCGSSFHGMIRCQAGKNVPAAARGFRGFRYGYGGPYRASIRGFRSRGRGYQRWR